MPEANGGKKHFSFPEPARAAGEGHPSGRHRRIEKPPRTPAKCGSASAGAGAANVPARAKERTGPPGPQKPGRDAPPARERARRPPDPWYCVAFDCWLPELDEVLTTCCARGRKGEREAMEAIRKSHPEIPPKIIWARIRYLGLTSSKRPPYLRHVWLPEDLELLHTNYKGGRANASHAIDLVLEKHPDWNRSTVSRKAKSLGLSRQRKNGYQRWSKDADRELISYDGSQLETVEGRMKRTKGSLWSRLLVLNRGAEFFGGFKTRDLKKRLHLDAKAVRRLKRKGLLTCKRGRITDESVKCLCRDHPEEIPFETLSPEEQHRLVKDYAYGKEKQAPKGGREKKQTTEEATQEATPDPIRQDAA